MGENNVVGHYNLHANSNDALLSDSMKFTIETNQDEKAKYGDIRSSVEKKKKCSCKNTRVPIGMFMLSETAKTPEYATKESACFDIYCDIVSQDDFVVYKKDNDKFFLSKTVVDGESVLVLKPGMRAMIPTGLIFDIPTGYKISILPRSSVALKHDVAPVNAPGTIDSDFFQQTLVLLSNRSKKDFVIRQHDRIAQGEIVPVYTADFTLLDEAPTQKTDRVGGFGSTGTNV